MKKSLIMIIVLVLFLFVVGCLDYKAYDIPKEEITDEASLVSEIASIEKEINTGEAAQPPEELSTPPPEENTEKVEEVVLPELSEETQPEIPKDALVITVKENEWVRLKIKGSDPDNDKVTYAFSPPLNSLGVWKTNYGDAGEYLVTVKANDGKLTTEKPIKIVVKRVNVPPVIEGIKDISVKEGETVRLAPKITDPNNDPVTVTISDPLKSGTWVTDHTSAGEYQINVLASDGELQAEKSFKLNVQDVNVPPKISGVDDLTVKEGEMVRIKPTVTDEDEEDTITVTISSPVGNKGIWETKYTDHGTYPVTITATDGKDTVTKRIQINVEDVNMPPEITDVSLEAS